jgi:hypothetical protein
MLACFASKELIKELPSLWVSDPVAQMDRAAVS